MRNRVLMYFLLGSFSIVFFVENSASLNVSKRKGRQEEEDEPEDEEESDEEDGNVSLGRFEAFSHDVSSGEVTLKDEKTIHIRNFKYDGLGPAAWFVVGTSNRYKQQFVTLSDAIAIPDENFTCDRLGKYRNENLKLKLPGKMKFSDYNYLSIYCLNFNENFGYVEIPDSKFRNGTAEGVDECPQELVRDSRRLKYRISPAHLRSKLHFK